MLRYEVGSASTEEREAGFLEVMKAEFPGVELISFDQYGGATRETAYKAAQNLLNRYGSSLTACLRERIHRERHAARAPGAGSCGQGPFHRFRRERPAALGP